MHDEESPQVGGAGGAASGRASDDATPEEWGTSSTSGDVEIPIGMPVDADELRRLKEEARDPRPGTGGSERGSQEDPGHDRPE
jgi:hypothetical protein